MEIRCDLRNVRRRQEKYSSTQEKAGGFPANVEEDNLRKKSHISLAMYLVDSLPEGELYRHRKAFYLGSILPDCMPSFLTTRHEIEVTFPKVRQEIAGLCKIKPMKTSDMRVFCRRLGEVMHYIADYFTFPHNQHFPGNLKEHCSYEEELKQKLRSFLKSEEAKQARREALNFLTPEEVCRYIQEKHAQYRKKLSCVENDIHQIIAICYQVLCGIWNLMLKAVREEHIGKKQEIPA